MFSTDAVNLRNNEISYKLNVILIFLRIYYFSKKKNAFQYI